MYHLTSDKKDLLYDLKCDSNQFENKVIDYKYKDALSEMSLRLALRLIDSECHLDEQSEERSPLKFICSMRFLSRLWQDRNDRFN